MWPTFYIPSLIRADDLDLVEVFDLDCYVPIIYYTPDEDSPSARAGDLVVLFVNSDMEGSASFPFSMNDANWKRYLWCPNSSNERRQYGTHSFTVLYRVLTGGDLSTTFSFTHSDGTQSSKELCARGYILRNFHPQIPLDCFSYGCSTIFDIDPRCRLFGILGGSASNVPGDFMFSALWLRTNPGNSADPFPTAGVKLSAPLADAWHNSLRDGGLGIANHISSGLRLTTEYLENLIPDQGWNAHLTNWTPYGLDTFTTNTGGPTESFAVLIANNVPGRHYAEVEVNLTAGVSYSFHSTIRIVTSDRDQVGVTVVPPSGGEFGFVGESLLNANGFGPHESTATPYLDPDSGRQVWWWGGVVGLGFDGVPNTQQYPMSLLFTAQETGVHKLRISVADGPDVTDLEHSNTSARAIVYRTALLEGFCSPTWVPSNYTGQLRRLQQGPIYHFNTSGSGFQSSQFVGAYSFVVNKNVPTLARAIMLPYLGLGIGGSKVGDDGLTITKPITVGNDADSPMLCTRQVYPDIDGTEQAYYAEIRLTSVGTSDDQNRIVVGPLHGRFWDMENNGQYGVYSWAQNGTFIRSGSASGLPSSAWSASAGTVIGVLVDYPNRLVNFYKNGTLIGSMAMITAAGEEHHKLPFMLVVYNAGASASVFEYVANLSGPFDYQPAGSIAWDWPNTP